jgi:dienelactone hydrolase
MLTVCVALCLRAAPVTQTYTYPSSVTSDANGPLDLVAELNYDNSRPNAPIAVVMHGYSGASGKTGEVRGNAQVLRDKGFFAVSVALRGRDGSDGARDSGGLEIYDIYDAVEAVKRDYPGFVDPATVYLTGYSGGGGNTMAALTKFPDTFNAAAAFFGMSDYGYNATNGWYFKGASSSHQAQMRTDIGDPTLGNTNVTDRYHARAANLASANNPYTEIHLFVNANETTCPPINMTSFYSNAVSQAAYAGEFSNITVHIGASGLYHDFNGNGLNDAGEQQDWPHGAPTASQQAAAETWFMERLLAGQLPRRALNASDSLFVAGFVKTSRFECRVGDGQQGALRLGYALTDSNTVFHAEVLSLDKQRTSRLSVATAVFAGQTVEVITNGVRAAAFVGGSPWVTETLRDGDTVELRALGPATLGWRAKLLAYYDFDNELHDQGTNAFHGISVTSGGAGVTFTDQVPPALAARSHEAAAFDGASWVKLPFLNLHGRARSGGVSVSFWTKGGSSVASWLLAEGCTTSTAPAYCFGPNAGVATFRAFVRTDANSGKLDRQSAGAVFDNAWHHVVWTDQAGTARLYIDGAAADAVSFAYTTGTLTMDTTTLGALVRKPADPKYPFRGLIDDFAVWDEALSTNSIAALSAGASPLELAGLLTDPSQPVQITDLRLASQTNIAFVFTGPRRSVQPRVWYTTNLSSAVWSPVAAPTATTLSNGEYYQSYERVPDSPSMFYKIRY